MKLLSVNPATHRLYLDAVLDSQIKTLSLTLQSSSKDIMDLLSTNNEKLLLILKIMVKKNGVKIFQNKVYQDRLVMEIKSILSHKETYILDFFLIWEDISYFFESRNQVANIGRGSSVGSLVNYLLGITKVDPVKENLLFERWFSPDQTPDIDFDCGNKEELVSYLKDKYGVVKSVQVQTYHKLKATLNEALSKTKMKYARKQMILEIIEPYLNKTHESQKDLLAEIIKAEPSFGSFLLSNPEVNHYLLSNLDQPKAMVNHASGLVLSIVDNLEMKNIEDKGIVKFDILTLNSYKMLNKDSSLSNVKKISTSKQNFNNIIKNNAPESIMGSSLKIYFSMFDDPVINNALEGAIVLAKSRPGPTLIAERLKNKIKDTRLEIVLQETHGELLFQEQVMKILKNVLTIDFFEANKILKSLLKRSSLFKEKRSEYVQRIGYNGEEIMAYLEDVAPYTFNKAHAIAYSYLELYLKNTDWKRRLIAASEE